MGSITLSSEEKPTLRRYPISLAGLVATAIFFAIETNSDIGVVLTFLGSPFWSILLINAAMIGVAIEVKKRRVSRKWALLPLIFYGGYYCVVALERVALHQLGRRYDAANAGVVTGFDPARQSLVFEQDGEGAWLTQNTALPVAYTANSNLPQGYFSNRLVGKEVCAKVRETPSLLHASIYTSGLRPATLEEPFCALTMPDQPELPIVTIAKEGTSDVEFILPINRITTTITMPNGGKFELLGGMARPLPWIPIPIVACFLKSFESIGTDCTARFNRGETTIIPESDDRNRSALTLAKALGLKPVAVDNRVATDSKIILAKLSALGGLTLERQWANVDAIIADPVAKIIDWQVQVLVNRPDILDKHADAIVIGLQRAAAVTGNARVSARESGLILARLISELPEESFMARGPRVLPVFAKADDEHWLWEADRLLARLGALGPDALPYLTNPRATINSVTKPGVEGLCRVGAPARAAAEPVLLDLWTHPSLRERDDKLMAIYVAMRRIGITPPPLINDKRDSLVKWQEVWAGISPSSPSRVCSVMKEYKARSDALNERRIKAKSK